MTNEYLQCLWDSFTAHPDKIAVVDNGSRCTTYSDLGSLTRHIAAGLAKLNLPPHSFIPILLPSSMEYLATEMAVWMAGHAIVPMGTTFPPERIEHIKNHCEAPFIIDEEKFKELAATPEEYKETHETIGMQENALLIYTSGSTGEPKGILHAFDSLAFLDKYTFGEPFTAEQVWGVSAPFYFIAAVAINFSTLKGGGELHLYTDEVKFDIQKMADYIADKGITHTFISPSVLANFHNHSKTLKSVFAGSEKLSGQASREGYTLYNAYGMSEMLGAFSPFRVDRPYDSTPVGKPAPDSPVKYMLVDNDDNPVPEGEEGELVVKGVFSKGYYKDPERTAKLYRNGWLHTGDIMRQLPDGNVLYVNRKDWMVKINGQRVEPGEVESAIKRIEGVKEAVVKGFRNPNGSEYICGYYTLRPGADIKPETIRETLIKRLPPYMVPLHIMKMDSFPLLPTGKANRKALLPPDVSELQTTYVAPTNDKEKALCEAFAQVFKMERVGIDDDFFMLGGDSIKVMGLQQKCHGLNLTSKIIYKGRTPKGIAQLCGQDTPQALSPIPASPVPLSQTQMGIYAESMARRGEAAYNNPLLLKLDPSIDALRLARAVEATIEAHPFVKLRIKEDTDGNPVMTAVNEPYIQKIEEMKEAELEILKPKLIQPFDLINDTLFRVRIIKTEKSLYFFTDFHHIIYDGTSMTIFAKDLNQAYAGEKLEAETWSGFNVAAEELALRSKDTYLEAKDWYLETFGKLEIDSVPLPDTKEEEIRFATHDLKLSLSIDSMQQFCRRLGITANVLAVGAFGKLLGAYTNLSESLFATIYNGRNSTRVARTIDMMVKTLPVYCRWQNNTPIADYLQSIKQQMLGAMNNDIYSFAELAAATGINSNVLFAYQGDYFTVDSICGKPAEPITLERNATGSPLDFQVFIRDGALVLHTEYMINRYSEKFIDEMTRSYSAILKSMTERDLMSDVELIDEEQKAELDKFNDNAVPYDKTQTVVSLFATAAAKYPDHIALIYNERQISYKEADDLTDRLAAEIKRRGLGKGDVVSILVPRSEWMVLASIGALKAGCGYQPLDHTYPKERLNFMVKDSEAKLLITSTDLRELLNEYTGDALLLSDMEKLPAAGKTVCDAKPEDLFTLLYTSGSTGVPKGVKLTHGNLVCFIDWYIRYYDLRPGQRVGAYASYGFDANMMDMYPALANGSAVCIVPEEIRLDMETLNAYIVKNNVTHMFMTTQVGRQFASDITQTSLQHLSMGGEKLISFPVPDTYKTYNAYGPTECTIFSTVYCLQAGQSDIPIGKMLENMKGYVVSPEGKRVPPGALGELWIAGPHVAAGYLNRPEKTAEVFKTNPFDGGDYAPLYRSGDVVRYCPDGNIDFVGRSDGQVKIRGFRVELSEVEAVIREYPGIKDATVAAFDHPSGGKFIAAYVVSDGTIDENALGDFIRERKPPYMVPAVTMQLEKIPLNQNHKVNRKALPEPEFKANEEEADNNRPLNALEQEIVSIVGKVIGNESLGVRTPFSNVGLTSILSIKVASQLYKRFGVEIPSKAILNGGSVESIENLILSYWMNPESAPKEETASAESAVVNSSPLSFPQTGVYFECMKHPTDVLYNVPALIRFDKSVAAHKLRDAVVAVVKAHPGLDTRFENTEQGVMQIQNEGGEPEVELLEMSDKELEAYKKGFVKPFRLSAGKLYRLCVVKTPSGTFLLTDFHHLVFDGTSFDIFLVQIKEALGGHLPEKESYTYFQYVTDEKKFEQSQQFEENKQYFAGMLSDLETASEIPADLKGKEENGSLMSVASPFDLAKVEKYARENGITPAAVMLAATFYTVSRYVNAPNVYLSTISSGRSDVRTGDTFGMFVNTLPLGIKIEDETAQEFIKKSAAVFQGIIEHEKYPFAKISADYGFQPQIVYEYQLGVITGGGFAELKGVEGLELNKAKFKLAIHIEQADGVPSVVAFYNDALYSKKLMEGIARSIVIVTDKLLANPEEKIKKIDLLDEIRGKEIEKFRTVATATPKFRFYQEGMEYYAAKNPDKKALIACDAEFTYAEFESITNRLANNLIRLGVKPKSRVALLLPRTSRVIISMFGVMKAGSAYIPCDPEYPTDRIQHILNDSEAAYILTTANRVHEFSNAIDVETLLEGNDTKPELQITPQDLAYLIYTSGSTGKPKGVMLRHESIANYLFDHPANSHIHSLATRAHTVLSITTISFDMSLKETGGALCNGLTLVFANEEQTTNPISLAKLFKETKADVFNTTPSRMLQFMELPAFTEAIGQCKVIMCGGEKYADGLLDKLRAAAPEAEIFNTYGPTEITVSSNCKELTHTDRVSVGKPLLNVTEFVVDKDGNELPAGIVGELYIGGLGVANGYNNLPDMTAERFIDFKGMRIYKSGDYARWTEEGDVEILGRTDNQIKLRGLRIELGEVEAAIAAIDGIKNVVVKIGKIKDEEHLAAYFTANRKIDIAELKAELGKSLTKYMVPTAYLQMDKMPLTPNGKTDVKSLPEPQVAASGEYEAPANDTEQKIADIFANILKLEKVGANDNFYELGGTSLVTTRVIIETDKLGFNVAYGDVFAHPTPRKLANFILGKDNDSKKDDEVADYDYSAVDAVLRQNNMHSFISGEQSKLGKVLLTGATGYLGIHILRELIDSDAECIYCLVRGKNEEDAAARLKTLLFYYFENAFEDLFGNKLRVLTGDVTDVLDPALKTDTLINCAAIVKHFSEGTEIEDVNIGGAAHCIDYCLATGAKMIQVSTASTRGLSVNGVPAPGAVFNEERLYMGQFLGNKYIYSKFIAERMLLEAVATKGLVGKIMRVGNLAPRSTDGEFQANFQTNSFMGRLKVYNMLGCCPYESRDGQVEFSPINEVAQAIIRLSTTPKECVVFHPYNNHNVLLGDVLSELKNIGNGVRFVEMAEFTKALDTAKEDPAKAKQLSSLLAYQNMAKGRSADVARQNAYTMQVLYRLGFSWSVTSWDYVDRFMNAIQGLGFFDE